MAAVDRADAERVVELVEKVVEGAGRLVGAEVETLVLGGVERGEQAPGQLAEAAGGEVVARSRRAGEADADLAVGVPQTPVVEFLPAAGDGSVRASGVRGDDQELAGGVDDLRRRWQFERFEQLQGGAFGEQRDLEGTAAQQLVRVLLRRAAFGEDEVLDAEEVALDEQDLLFGPAFAQRTRVRLRFPARDASARARWPARRWPCCGRRGRPPA
jgi:hypothetical protein